MAEIILPIPTGLDELVDGKPAGDRHIGYGMLAARYPMGPKNGFAYDEAEEIRAPAAKNQRAKDR